MGARLQMRIRKSTECDFEQIKEIYCCARKFMKEHGNPTQWGDEYPQETLIKEDILQGNSYVCVDGERILAVFYFAAEDDVTYHKIEQGEWITDGPYAVVHRIASREGERGVASFCLSWCFSKQKNIKIDTHRDNYVMQKFLKKQGFAYCGIIHVKDGSERLAYQKVLTVQPVRITEAEELLAIYAPYVKNTTVSFEYEAPSLSEFKERILTISERYPYLTAKLNGEIVGYAYAGPLKARTAYDHSVETTIYLKDGILRQGVGAFLYEQLLIQLKDRGILNAYACITEENKDSIAFHERMGFVKNAHFHKCGYKFDRWLDMIFMERFLSEHTSF